jgi:hypothetical protein
MATWFSANVFSATVNEQDSVSVFQLYSILMPASLEWTTPTILYMSWIGFWLLVGWISPEHGLMGLIPSAACAAIWWGFLLIAGVFGNLVGWSGVSWNETGAMAIAGIAFILYLTVGALATFSSVILTDREF